MTTTQTVPAIAPATVEGEASVAAITLSWPSEPGDTAIDGGAGRARGLHIIELIGDLDANLAARVRDIFTSLAAQGGDFTVDVSQLRFVDASGLGMLATLHQRVSGSGGQLSLIGAAPSLRRILHITQLTYLLAGDPSCR
jgi:anti-anti-sigma factor